MSDGGRHERPAGEEPGQEWANFLGMLFVYVPPGQFLMGGSDEAAQDWEKPVHPVRVQRGFWLGKHPVTQEQWERVMGANPSWFPGEGERPVERVSYADCVEFLAKLAAVAGGSYRLPCEAEWEYACRAGTTEARYAGAGVTAWYEDTAEGTTHPVGEKQGNAWGLHDMLGNVWELCEDGWNDGYEGAPRDTRPWAAAAGLRVLRGGSWSGDLWDCRASSRMSVTPEGRFDDAGLRVVAVPAGA